MATAENQSPSKHDDVAVSKESASEFAHARVFDLLRARVVSDSEVLDIPCGSGAFTQRLVEAGFTVSAADVEQHPAVPQMTFKQADMDEPLPFEDACFDAIVSIEGIEHIKRPFDFIRECARILRPGAPLVITTPNISSLRSRWRWFLTGFHNKAKYPLDEQNPQPRHHINMLSFPELRYMLHTNGFHIEEIATNRVKAASWLYAPWAPFLSLIAGPILHRGAKTEAHRKQIAEIAQQMRTPPLLFGETMILLARRE